MAALGSQSIASSYEQLLHVDRDGGGNGTTHVSVKDGDNETTFGFTIATDALMMTGTNRLEFGDTGTYIHQSADGVLDLVSDTELELNATTIDMNGAVDMSSTLTVAGDVNIDSNTLFVDTSGNKVGLGTNSPTGKLSVAGASGVDSNIYLDNLDANSDGANIIVRKSKHASTLTAVVENDSLGSIVFQGIDDTSNPSYETAASIHSEVDGTPGNGDMPGRLVFKTTADGASSATERMRISSSGDATFSGAVIPNAGIQFPASQVADADANTLDDYEEGTYTITASMSSGSITFVSGKNEAHYVKIGRKVFVSGEVGVSSVSSPSGTLFLNLPFTVGDFTDLSERFIGPFSIQNCNFDDAVNSLHISSYSGQNTASIQMTTDNSGWSYLNANTITGSTEFSFSFCYSV